MTMYDILNANELDEIENYRMLKKEGLSFLSDEGLELVKKAIDKQVPMKPLYKHYEEKGDAPYIKICCPNNCGIQLRPITERRLVCEHDYCPKCGQRIDWTDWELEFIGDMFK